MTKIPGEVWFTLDVRSEDNAVLLALDRELRAHGRRDRQATGRRHRPRPLHQLPCRGRSTASIAAVSKRWRARSASRRSAMASGAGHDAAVFANCGVPTAMIFVRNEHGSHNPDEAMDARRLRAGPQAAGGRRGRDRWRAVSRATAGRRKGDVAADEAVYGAIRRAMHMGRLSPGTKLQEPVLARVLKVSRERVRKALHRLVHEGWLQAVPNRGTFVPSADGRGDAARSTTCARCWRPPSCGG